MIEVSRIPQTDPDCAVDPEFRTVGDLVVADEFVTLLSDSGLDSLDALFAATGETLLKPGLDPHRQRFKLVIGRQDSQQTFFLKRYLRPPKNLHKRKGASLAGAEWSRIIQLRAEGLPCPAPVAFGEEIRRGREVRSALLMTAVPGESIESWMRRNPVPNRADVAGLLGPTAELIARFHRAGFVHRDLYWSHIFYEGGIARRSFHLIDLSRVLRPKRRKIRWIVKDLASLNFSSPISVIRQTDRIRWVRRYLGVSKLTTREKCLVYRIVGKTAAIARHDARRRARIDPTGHLTSSPKTSAPERNSPPSSGTGCQVSSSNKGASSIVQSNPSGQLVQPEITARFHAAKTPTAAPIVGSSVS